MHKEMNQTLRKSLMVALTSKLELKGFLWRNLYSLITCVANPTLPTKSTSFEILYHMPHCAYEYAKEKEKKKKKTTIIKYHGELLTTMSNCLLNNTLVY